MSETEYIECRIPKMDIGSKMLLKNVDGNYVVSEINNDINLVSEYDTRKLQHLYDKFLEQQNSTTTLTSSDLDSTLQNIQFDRDKVIKANGYVAYYINKDDIVGRIIEILENNINENFRISYPTNAIEGTGKKRERKIIENIMLGIDAFNEQIELKTLIEKVVSGTYMEGNYVTYLRQDSESWSITKYPLDLIEVSDFMIDNGEPILVFDVQKLKIRLQSAANRYGTMKANQRVEIEELIDKQVQRDYPEEVYEAYSKGDRYVYLDPARASIVRINNFGKKYGVSPIAKAFSPLLTLETIDKVDRQKISDSSKKIIYQKMRDKMINETGDCDMNIVSYAQASLLESMTVEGSVIYTSIPQVEELQIIEPKLELVDNDKVNDYRNRVFGALGISFLNNTTKNSANVVTINFEELLRTINKIVRKIEMVINKYYRTFMEANGFDLMYAPTLHIQDTRLSTEDARNKLVDLLYSKLNCSYKTAYEIVGIDINEERRRRESEMDNGYEEIFTPHITAFTAGGSGASAGESLDQNGTKNSNGSAKSKNTDKALEDKTNNSV